VRVLTVDDEPAFRRVACRVVRATPGFEPVGEADSGENAVALAALLHPHLVLMDVRMPGMGGVEAARRIAASERGTVVVLMSADPGMAGARAPGAATGGEVLGKERLTPRTLAALWARRSGPRPARAGGAPDQAGERAPHSRR
jgi:CheY-like chemotaxis protein